MTRSHVTRVGEILRGLCPRQQTRDVLVGGAQLPGHPPPLPGSQPGIYIQRAPMTHLCLVLLEVLVKFVRCLGACLPALPFSSRQHAWAAFAAALCARRSLAYDSITIVSNSLPFFFLRPICHARRHLAAELCDSTTTRLSPQSSRRCAKSTVWNTSTSTPSGKPWGPTSPT